MSVPFKAFSKLFFVCFLFIKAAVAQSQSATLQVNLNKEVGDMYPMWAWFGYDEPNYTYMKDGKKLLQASEAHCKKWSVVG